MAVTVLMNAKRLFNNSLIITNNATYSLVFSSEVVREGGRTEPKIIKTKNYIEFIGHYDDIAKCAKLSALATLWSIEAKYGYIKFPIEYEEQINKVLECDKLYAGLNSLGLRTYTTNTSSLLYNYKLNKTFSNNWVVNSNTNFNGKWGNYIWYDGEYYNCFINYPLANYRYVNGVWSTYNNGYTSIPSFTGTTVFYTKNNTFFGNGNNNGNGWYKFENEAFVKKASDPDWRNGYYTWTDGTNIYHDGFGGRSGTSTSKQYLQWVFNESNCTWSTKAWTNLTSSYNVFNIWTDGDNIYLSQGSTQLVLNKATSTWESKSWSGLTSFTGEDVWTDGHDIYYSANSNHYVLNKKTSTWQQKTWTGLTSFNGRNTWTDGVNLYYSVNETQYILEQVEPVSNSISIGTLPLSASYIGTSEVNKIYFGTSLLYEKQAPSISYNIAISEYNTSQSNLNYKSYLKIYDGQDRTGTLLINSTGTTAMSQTSFTCTTGYLYLENYSSLGAGYTQIGKQNIVGNISQVGIGYDSNPDGSTYIIMKVDGDGSFQVWTDYNYD